MARMSIRRCRYERFLCGPCGLLMEADDQPAGKGTFSQPDNFSTARPMRNTIGSSNARPVICTPSGKLFGASPTGTLIAGCPLTLNGMVCIGDAEDIASIDSSNRGAVLRAESVSNAS